MTLERYRAIVVDQQRKIDRLVQARGVAPVRSIYADILRQLEGAVDELPETYSATVRAGMLAQVRAGMVRFISQGATALDAATADAMATASRDAFQLLATMEHQFTGAVLPLPIGQIARLRGLKEAPASLLRAHQRSLSRYGAHVVTRAEEELAASLALGESTHQAMDRLDGMVDGEWYRAERIVRTEYAHAYNGEHRETYDAASEEFDGDLWSQWSEHVSADGSPLDDRVAVDSLAMHGQVARPGELFTQPPTSPAPDAKGRTDVPAGLVGQSWEFPPNRPNDRSVLIPWRPHWEIPGWVWRDGRRMPVTGAGDRARVPDVRPEPAPAPEPGPTPEPVPEPVRREASAPPAPEPTPLEETPGIDRTDYHPNHAIDIYAEHMPAGGVAEVEAKVSERMHEYTGKPVSLAEISHGFSVPDGYKATLKHVATDDPSALGLEWHITNAAGARVGTLSRSFFPGGEVHHGALFIQSEYQGAGIAASINGAALRRYKSWGIEQATVHAVEVGRYAWARLGFNFDSPGMALENFQHWVASHPHLLDRIDELTEKARVLINEPHKLAAWREPGVTFTHQIHGKDEEIDIGKAFFLKGEEWNGTMAIDDANDGYRNALRLTETRKQDEQAQAAAAARHR